MVSFPRELLPAAVSSASARVAGYLRTFGPVTERDLVWWFGATKGTMPAHALLVADHAGPLGDEQALAVVVGVRDGAGAGVEEHRHRTVVL